MVDPAPFSCARAYGLKIARAASESHTAVKGSNPCKTIFFPLSIHELSSDLSGQELEDKISMTGSCNS